MGRSHCDSCKKTLHWNDLVPVISFVLLGGRCRYCRKKLSFQYPLIELVGGLLFVFIYSHFIELGALPVILLLIIYSGLLAIFMTDIKYRIIPDEVLIVLIAAAVGFRILHGLHDVAISILAGFGLFLLFLFLVLITKGKGMGMGDVKYAFFMGLFLGFPQILIGFYGAFLTGAIFSLILILAGSKKFGQTVAFGPFLVFGTIVAHIWGNNLWMIYARLIGF